MQVIYQNYPVVTYIAEKNSFAERKTALMLGMDCTFPAVKNILSNPKTLMDAAHCNKGFYQFNQELTFVILKVEQ